MKPHPIVLTLCLMYSGLLSAQSGANAALVLAVSNYAPQTNWPPTYAANDVPLLVNTLKQLGFKPENIRVLQDEAATRASIEKAIANDLLAKAEPGGTVLVHFSGHGQQVQDDNSDEADGLDEALAAYDSPKDFKAGQYQGENLIRDEQLSQMLEPVRRKLGPTGRLLVVVDASYNGVRIRGQRAGRGADVIMADPGFLEALNNRAPSARPEYFNLLTADLEADRAPLAVFLASSGGEPATEMLADDNTPVGALTYAFTRALAESPPGATCGELMSAIRRMMGARAPLQTPGLGGDGQMTLLSGPDQAIRRINVAKYDHKKQQVWLSAGLLQGVQSGSEMAFYPANVRDTAGIKPLATGLVTASGLSDAVVQIEGKRKKALPANCWAAFRHRSFGALQVSVHLEIGDTALRERVRARCNKMPFVRLTDQNAALHVTSPAPGHLELYSQAGAVLWRDVVAPTLPDAFAERIRDFARAQYLREMHLAEPSLAATLDLIPVQGATASGKTVEKARFPLSERTDSLGNICMHSDDYYKVSITNRGDRPAYYALLYIHPDDECTVLFQPTGKDAGFRLEPGESREYRSMFRIPPGEGARILKLIASAEPVDLKAVLENKGQLLRGEKTRDWNSVEQFFAGSFTDNNGALPDMPPGAAHIHTVVFTAKK